MPLAPTSISRSTLSTQTQNTPRAWTLFFFALFFFSVIAHFKTALGGDERDYLAAAQTLLTKGNWPDPNSVPLYGLVMACLEHLGVPSLLAGRLVYVFSYALLVFPLSQLYHITWKNNPPTYSILITLLTPGLALLPLYSGTHPLFIFCAYSALSLLLRGLTQHDTPLFFLAGIASGFAMLARLDGNLYCLLFTLGLIGRLLFSKHKKIAALQLAFFLLGIFLIIAPWQSYLQTQGYFVSPLIWHKKHPTAINALREILNEPHKVDVHLRTALMRIVLMTRLYCENLASIRFMPIYLWIFVGAGSITLRSKKMLWFLLTPVIVSFAYLFFHVIARYLSPMIPIITGFAVNGMQYLFAFLPKKSYRDLLFMAVIASLMLSDSLYLIYGHPTYQKDSQTLQQQYNAILAPSQADNAVMPVDLAL